MDSLYAPLAEQSCPFSTFQFHYSLEVKTSLKKKNEDFSSACYLTLTSFLLLPW